MLKRSAIGRLLIVRFSSRDKKKIAFVSLVLRTLISWRFLVAGVQKRMSHGCQCGEDVSKVCGQITYVFFIIFTLLNVAFVQIRH